MASELDVSQGRSPRYPRFPLLAAVTYAKRLYDGAHRSALDTVTAYRVMGFAGKSGASATALGAARQYGLVESVKGGVRISDLGLSILEPSSESEYANSLKVAAHQPQVFGQILDHFGELPRSDEPIRSYLIRTLSFSKSGADDCISALRETLSELPQIPHAKDIRVPEPISPGITDAPLMTVVAETQQQSHSNAPALMRFPLTKECEAELRFTGALSVQALDRLIRHIELLKGVWEED